MNMKKLVSMVLALVMLLAMSTNAMAANNNQHTITIANTTAGYTYEAYRVFEGTLVDGELTDIAWSNGVNATNLMTALKEIDAFEDCETAVDVAAVLGGITAENHVTTQAFADAVAANLATKAGEANAVTTKVNANGQSVEGYHIGVTGDGYYFVKTTTVPAATETTSEGVHTRYILKVVGDVTVTHKGNVPTVEKKIVENEKDVDSVDKNIGDTVNFKLTATLPSDYELFKTYTLTFHDQLSAGLSLDDTSFKVFVDGTEIATSLYTVDTEGLTDGCTFEVVIPNVKATAANNESTIVVTYNATLNGEAEIGDPGNPNKVKLEYTNNPNNDGTGTPETGKTPEDKVVVFTYELDVTKVDGVNNNITLANAQFSLLSSDEKKIAKFDSNGKLVEWVAIESVTATNGVYPDDYTLTTDADGIIKMIGLDAGTYKLKETVAPNGYNLPEAPFTVVITATTTENGITSLSATVGGVEDEGDPSTGIVEGTIENNSGATLPETGAQGTKMIYMAGGILVAAAAILLITKRRMNAAE